MADSNIQTFDTVKPITLEEYNERTAHLQENTTSLLSAIDDRQVQAAGLATQAYSLASEVNAVAEQASLSFSKKTWEDNATSGTPITAAELNRLENAISNLTTAVNNLQDSVSNEVFASYDGVSVTVTPSRDCTILAVCGWAGTWAYGGGEAKLSIDCPELTPFLKQVSSIINGDTIGRDMASRAIFTGAKKGASYRITRAVTGSPQGSGDQRLFAICL